MKWPSCDLKPFYQAWASMLGITMQHYLSMRIEFCQKLLYLKDRSSRENILNDRVRKDLGSKQETEVSNNQRFKFIKENVTCHSTDKKKKKR